MAANLIADPLVRLRARYAQSRLPGFLRWWGGELAALIPLRWRALLLRGNARLLYEAQGQDLRVLAAGDGQERELLRLPLSEAAALAPSLEAALGDRAGARPRWLLLSGERVLRRRMSLPAAAADRLRDVLAFELDRQTPFRSEEVAFDHRLLRRDETTRQLEVELVVLPRAALDAALAPLGPQAAHLDGVDVRDPDAPAEGGGTLGVNLLPPDRRAARRDPTRWLNLALLALAALGTGIALWQTLENRRAAVAALSEQIDQRKREAQQVQRLRAQLDDAAGGANFLARARAARPTMLELLNDITRRVPDGSWLERLSVNSDKVALVGLSEQASSLVAALQPSPFLRSPALSGSVQADPRNRRDRFTVAADLAVAAEAPAKGGARDGKLNGANSTQPDTEASDAAAAPRR